MDINIDGKVFSINTLGDFKRAGEEIKRVNQFKIDLVKNKYERLKDRSSADRDANRELQEVHKWYQDTLDKLWKAKAELGNSKDMNYYAKLAEKKNSVVKKGTLSTGNRYEIKKEKESFSTTGFSYIGYVYDRASDEVYKTSPCDSIEQCERDIMQHKTFKAYNSKDNSKVLDAEIMSYTDPNTREKYWTVWLVTDEGWRNPRIFKTFQEADREVARIQREVKSQNSKENSMNYYEKIIQEKQNYKIFGMDGDQYESRHISEYARKFADGLKKGLISESQIVSNLIIDYGWSRKNAEKVAEEAKKIARHNSKEEKDNMKLEAKEEYKGYIIEVYKDNKYVYLAYKKGSSSMHKYAYGVADSVSEGISRAKNALDVNNSKEEKDNSTVIRGTVHGHKYEVDRMSDGSYMGYVYDEEDFPIFKTGLHSTSSGAEKEIKSKVFNSKDNSKSYYQELVEKKNALPEFKYCYQAMQWFKEGSQYAEVIDKLVDRFHLDKSTAAAAAQKGQQMYEDGYRNK